MTAARSSFAHRPLKSNSQQPRQLLQQPDLPQTRRKAQYPNRRIERIERQLEKKHGRNWTVEMDDILRNPNLTMPEIVAAVSALGRKRSERAVRMRMYRIGIQYGAPGMTAQQIAYLLGIDDAVVQRWCNAGVIRSRKTTDRRYAHNVVLREDVLAFIREQPTRYDYRLIKDRQIRALAEVAWRSAGLLRVEEVAAYLNVSSSMVEYHANRHGCISYIVGWRKRRFYYRDEIYKLQKQIAPCPFKVGHTWCHCGEPNGNGKGRLLSARTSNGDSLTQQTLLPQVQRANGDGRSDGIGLASTHVGASESTDDSDA